jgi:ATP-dependent Clp protease ATP-binding subunit ClpC
VGAGGAEGAIDASNVLKPALSRGEVQCIGATTLDEYRKYIEKDGALERRFQTIMVDPPTKPQALEILKGLRDKYEAHHRVRITDEALASAVELSDRYITGRFLPDKAIDVMDEAGARVRLKALTRPPDIADLEREIKNLDKEKAECVANQDFERAANLRDSSSKLRKKKDSVTRRWKEGSKDIDGTVDDNVIAETVSNMTGIPLTRLEKGEKERLLAMEDRLKERVINQDEAITTIARAVRNARAGLRDPRRPTGSFVFLGPTGVGKTLLARALAEFMFGDEDALIQVDMSEYMEKHNVSRLVGAPPGYVGFEEGGQLTEKIRRRPYSVVLLDEIEKSHPEVFNMLLQIMEEGRLTDSFGRHINFKNVVLIMTSNIGASVIKNQASLGFQVRDAKTSHANMKKQLMDEVNKHFRPEFLNRLDEIIVFKNLERENMLHIIDIEIKDVVERLLAQGIHFRLTDEAKAFIVDHDYNPDFGARPLRRSIERLLENPLSDSILRGEFDEKDHVSVRVQDGRLVFDAGNGSFPDYPGAEEEPAGVGANGSLDTES